MANQPDQIIIGRRRYKHVLFTVDERDESGRPRKLTLLNDNEVFTPGEAPPFMTGYVPEELVSLESSKCRN